MGSRAQVKTIESRRNNGSDKDIHQQRAEGVFRGKEGSGQVYPGGCFAPQSGPQYGPQSGPQEKLAERYRGLLETIVAKPTISKEDLAAQFKISLTTLKRDLKCLRQSYEITWIGWTQNGHWEVKELEKKKQ